MCNYNHELCQYDLRNKTKYEVNQHYFDFVKNATSKETEAHGYKSFCGTYGIYKCKICGEELFVQKAAFKKHLQVCKNRCNGTKVGSSYNTTVIGYNNIAITQPEYVKYFVNKDDVYKNTQGSVTKVELKCPCCSAQKTIKTRIVDLVKQGFSCEFCGDGVSYPEKIMALVLNKLNIEYKRQFIFNGYNNYRYDFILMDSNVIIEVHGEQHYHYTGFKRSYDVEHENDMVKFDIAILHGYVFNKNFFIINAEHSNIEWLRNSIEQCTLFKQYDLHSIDWEEIDREAQKSLKVEVCKYWENEKNINENLTTVELAEVFGISAVTILKYLKWGNNNGICTYNGTDEKRRKNERESIKVFFIKPNGELWFNKSMSQRELARETGITQTTIRRRTNSAKPLQGTTSTSYDQKYIGSYIVSEDEYYKLH